MSSLANKKAPLAFIAALPRELLPFARDLGLEPSMARDGISVRRSGTATINAPVLVASAGMGPGRVALAVEAALSFGPVAALLSVGFAGACDPLLLTGSVLRAAVVVDALTGERFGADASFTPESQAVIVTGPAIAGPLEKGRLHRSYGAAAVDMEAATVARLARARAIPFGAIKAISDGVLDDLTPLSSFTGRRGEFRTAAFALHTATHPAGWRAAAKLGRNSKAALSSLTSALHELIHEQG